MASLKYLCLLVDYCLIQITPVCGGNICFGFIQCDEVFSVHTCTYEVKISEEVCER